MAKGTVYTSERAILCDARSGLRVIRLTHYGCISMCLYFEQCSFTEDEQHVILMSQRGAHRDAPWDLIRVASDGREIVQLTECDDMGGPSVCTGGGCAFYQSGGELRRVNVMTLEDEAVAKFPGKALRINAALGASDYRGTMYFGTATTEKGTCIVFRADVATGKIETLFEGRSQNHVHVEPSGRTVFFNEITPENTYAPYLVESDGSRLRPFPFTRFAHHTWLGDTGKMQGCLVPPGNALVTFGEDDEEPMPITGGRYYWHSSSSLDGEWIVSDTNWPQEGLYLVHVATGNVTYICDPRSSCSHPQWTHPHPSFSPRMKYVLFNSDLTGIGQAYVVELTDEFREQAAQGYVCTPQIWQK